MRIAIIGAGNVGSTLGKGWLAAGHDVRYGVRDPADPKNAALGRERLQKPAEAAAAAEVVVLTTPWNAAIDAVKGLGDLAGKVLIDCTNPLTMGPGGLGLALGYDDSAGEQVARAAGGAAVFKALNTTGAENMGQAKAFATPPAMFFAGDEADRKPIVSALLRDLGFEPVDAGPLRNARLLEPLAMLWIDQAYARGAGRNFAFALTRRS